MGAPVSSNYQRAVARNHRVADFAVDGYDRLNRSIQEWAGLVNVGPHSWRGAASGLSLVGP